MELKLLLDRKNQKVVFAEADKELVDFLFSIMGLPLGTTIKLLQDKNIMGCLGNIHDSINTMSEPYFNGKQNKEAVLNPKFRIPSKASLNLPCSRPVIIENRMEVFICGNHAYVSDDRNSVCTDCKKPMVRGKWFSSYKFEDGIVNEVPKYMVMDNLEVKPMSNVSSFALMQSFGFLDFTSLEETVVHIGHDQALRLLQLSFQTKNVLTTAFFGAPTD